MPAWLNGAIRALLQAGWAWLVVYAAAKAGVHLPEHEPVWVDAAASAGVLAAIVAAVQWAERRSDKTLVGRALRWAASWAMLRLRPAVYPQLSGGSTQAQDAAIRQALDGLTVHIDGDRVGRVPPPPNRGMRRGG